MSNRKLIVASISSLVLAFFLGCGSDENSVIAPGEDYQLTEQEQINREAEEAARRGES